MNLIEIRHGELVKDLTDSLAARGVTTGLIWFFGQVERFEMSSGPLGSVTMLDQPAEICSGQGELVGGLPQLHALMRLADGTVQGRLHSALVGAHGVRVWVQPQHAFTGQWGGPVAARDGWMT
ncbi:hypothetical protein [Nonomuraea longicatena]|uniref:PPC domain-containing protein n=1 Tax=Nonomuraea longicatena TaxID=83682 RepID=A0ABN1NLR1_9ACTN